MGLLASLDISQKIVLVIGSVGGTSRRVSALVQHNAFPIVINDASDELKKVDGARYLDRNFEDSDLTSLGRQDVDCVVDYVFVVLPKNQYSLADHISRMCKRLRIPVNVSDTPELCTFTLLSTYSDGDFQLGVSTSGKGCRLASRLKRHVVNSLPKNVAEICTRVGELRDSIKVDSEEVDVIGQNDEDSEQDHKFNRLVVNGSEQELHKRRMRWLSQVVEYYPFSKLASLSFEDLKESYTNTIDVDIRGISNNIGTGSITLVGSGPGSELLLTQAARNAIESADMVLADKLVPSQILDLIPRHTPLHIAKKFPGNAERAQQELMNLGIQAIKEGKHVVRLKQGDPYVFGRGGEEYTYFSSHGYAPLVIPGITSALSAPMTANIPVTNRDYADQVLICTATGKGGKSPVVPEWVDTRTYVFLMALHRIGDLVNDLTVQVGWSGKIPCAVIERANCPDQRVIRTKLEYVTEAIESVGSRPPGLLVVGHSCQALVKVDPTQKWVIEDGLR